MVNAIVALACNLTLLGCVLLLCWRIRMALRVQKKHIEEQSHGFHMVVSGEHGEDLRTGRASLIAVVTFNHKSERLGFGFPQNMDESEGRAMLAKFGIHFGGSDD